MNYSPKHVELTGIINKPLLLRLVGCLYNCISDARSYKHQILYECILYILYYIFSYIQHNGNIALEKRNDYSIMGNCRDIYCV